MTTPMRETRTAGTSEAVTRDIRVSVEAQYSPAHSHPANQQWFFLYTIRISNEGQETVQLISRHWLITDANDRVDEVRGLGVVGQQPVLAPGESFEYTSGCPLSTAFGMMKGTYHMVTDPAASGSSTILPPSACKGRTRSTDSPPRAAGQSQQHGLRGGPTISFHASRSEAPPR